MWTNIGFFKHGSEYLNSMKCGRFFTGEGSICLKCYSVWRSLLLS